MFLEEIESPFASYRASNAQIAKMHETVLPSQKTFKDVLLTSTTGVKTDLTTIYARTAALYSSQRKKDQFIIHQKSGTTEVDASAQKMSVENTLKEVFLNLYFINFYKFIIHSLFPIFIFKLILYFNFILLKLCIIYSYAKRN